MAQQGGRLKSFFKVMFDPTLRSHKMKMPLRFVNRCGDQLDNDVMLLVLDGHRWHLELTREGKFLYFDKGFREFMEFYSLSCGYVLLFYFKGDSTFYVQIYDLSTSKINYPDNSEDNTLHMSGNNVNTQVNNAIDKGKEQASLSIEEIVISPNTREATSEEIGIPLNGAWALKSDFSLFKTQFRKYNVNHPYILHIP